MNIRKIGGICALLIGMQTAAAQSAYISCSPYEKADRFEALSGKRGILILSKRSDLVITVSNAPEVQASAAQRRSDGLYEYALVLDPNTPRQPKIEVNRRGDVDRVDWVTVPKADYFSAYLIEETAKPIRLEDQTAVNSAILDASLCEVEFQTTIPDLTVDCQELVKCGATVEKGSKKGDASIQITRVIIPVSVILQAQQETESASKAWQSLYDQLMGKDDAPASEWEKLDLLKEKKTKAAEDYQRLTHLNVYATGTNQLPVDISGLRPRSKMVYGVLLRTIIEEKHVSKCAGFMAEGGRQFALREYDNARQSFLNALKSSDTPSDMVPSIRNTIAQCDSCIKYENLTYRALKRINELKKQGTVAQTDILDYYGAAADFMRIVEKYNPCDYYAKNIRTLETFIENMPLAMRFTITRWIVDRVSAHEGGAFPNVEMWAYYGNTPPRLQDFSDDKSFRHIASEYPDQFRQIGTSDVNGVVDVEFVRKVLPMGLFFRPTTDKKMADIVYKDMTNVMNQSVGEYNKRQFRQKMYIRKLKN